MKTNTKKFGILALLTVLLIGVVSVSAWTQEQGTSGSGSSDTTEAWHATNVFEPYAVKEIPGAFYFTPAASSKEFAIFGYMSKITPMPQEIEAEKKRINKIIDESVKNGYGSWENFENEMRKVGEQTAQSEKKKAPEWLQSLLPPSLIKEAVPLLMKGALLYAKAHPEAMREPVGNVGETGVIVVNRWGEVTKIPLGINTPVVSIDISPDGGTAAVLTDMSFEDENGNLHPLGEISLINLNTKTRTYSWIFANLAGHLAFVPGTNWLAFDCYTDMNDFGKQDIWFLGLRTKQVLKYHFHTYGNASALVYGKNVTYPNFVFGLDPTSHDPLVALYSKGYFEIHNIMLNQKLLKVLANGYTLAFAHNCPWVFSGVGELWDYRNKNLISSVKLAAGKSFPAIYAKFTKDDRSIIYVGPFGYPKRFDTDTKRTVKSCDFYSRAGVSFLTPDDRFLISFWEGKGMVAYKKHYLKRSKLCLHIIDTQNLRTRQNICFKNSTVIDAAMAGNTLIVSNFDQLYVYVNAASIASAQPLPSETHGSLLEEIEKSPEKFADKIIELDGWAWGWMAQPPEGVDVSSLRSASHNYGSRMDGTFTDGVVSILYPVPVKFSGPFHLKARVVITPAGWQLVPVD